MSQFDQHISPHSTTQEYPQEYSDDSYEDEIVLNMNENITEDNTNDSYKIFSNTPISVPHFIGDTHETILDSIYDDVTQDNMNPFIVLLGTEGMGKTVITSTLCNDLLQENNQLFKNGIIYVDLIKWYNLYKCRTFEDCLIHGIQQTNLNTYWIEKYDDFLDITQSNIFNKIDQYLSNALIIFEDFDRFQEMANISLEHCNEFLFHLFENLSITTKIIITSRKKLPIYYNFNLFRTKFYQLESFNQSDALNYLLTYCPTFKQQDIIPYVDDIRDLTAYKPIFLYKLYKLWDSIRLFESTFDSIITLYGQIDTPQMFAQHNPYINTSNTGSQSQSQSRSQSQSSDRDREILLTSSISSPSLSNSNNSNNSRSSNTNNAFPDMSPILNKKYSHSPVPYTRTNSNGKQPLFGYTNLYNGSPSYHSPLSTFEISYFTYPSEKNIHDDNNDNVNENNNNSVRRRSDIQQFYRTSNNKTPKKKYIKSKFDSDRRGSAQIQQFYKVTNVGKQRYSFADRHNYDKKNNNTLSENKEHETVILSPLTMSHAMPLTPILSNRSLSSNDFHLKNKNKNMKHQNNIKKRKSLMAHSFTIYEISENEQEKKRKKKKSNYQKVNKTKTVTKTETKPSIQPVPIVGTLNANNLKKHLKNISLTSLNLNESDALDINVDKVLAIEDNGNESVDNGNNNIEITGNETYDQFLAALGAEIHRQQRQEHENDFAMANETTGRLKHTNFNSNEEKSMQNYNIRINDVDITPKPAKTQANMLYNNNNNNSNNSTPHHNGIGFLNVYDLPATPPLSSCGGIMSDGSMEDHMNMNGIDSDDNISVNSDTIQQNKLMSINLIKNDYNKMSSKKKHKSKHKMKKNYGHKKSYKHNRIKHVENNNHSKNNIHIVNENNKTMKVGNVYYNKFLRMTLLLNISIDSISYKWLINGIAKSLRTSDIRFNIHKNENIANNYSYISLLCRCDEFDIKQLKNTFEFTFISHELQKCIAQSLGKPQLKIICASCVSYRHYKYLYSKEFLNWITHTNINRNANINGINKMSIINADYIQLPFAQKSILPNNNNNNKPKNSSNKVLTPPNMTILHFMSVLL